MKVYFSMCFAMLWMIAGTSFGQSSLPTKVNSVLHQAKVVIHPDLHAHFSAADMVLDAWELSSGYSIHLARCMSNNLPQYDVQGWPFATPTSEPFAMIHDWTDYYTNVDQESWESDLYHCKPGFEPFFGPLGSGKEYMYSGEYISPVNEDEQILPGNNSPYHKCTHPTGMSQGWKFRLIAPCVPQ